MTAPTTGEVTGETCQSCEAAFSELQAERDRALRALDIADHEVSRARARLKDVDDKLSRWRLRRQCSDHRNARHKEVDRG